MNNPSELSLAFLEFKPADAANVLQQFSPELAVEYLLPLPLPVVIPVIDKMLTWPAARILSLMPAQLSADVLCGSTTGDAESILRLMDVEPRNAVLEHMPEAIAKSFTQKLVYPLSTVGAWMDTDVPFFTTDSSVEHCLDLVKRQKSTLGGVVIVADTRRRLVGLVEVEKLLTSDGERALVDLLNKDMNPLSARATLWEVAEYEGWAKFPSLPVVDHNNIVLGSLRHGSLLAGTAKPAEAPVDNMRFSMLAHIGKAFFVCIGGLLQVISGIAPQSTEAVHPAPDSDKRRTGEGY